MKKASKQRMRELQRKDQNDEITRAELRELTKLEDEYDEHLDKAQDDAEDDPKEDDPKDDDPKDEDPKADDDPKDDDPKDEDDNPIDEEPEQEHRFYRHGKRGR